MSLETECVRLGTVKLLGSIPTLASISKWLIEDKLESLAGLVCMELCME
jgi:hypothetical protein